MSRRGAESCVRPPLVSVLVATALTLILMGRSDGPLAGGAGALRAVARAAFQPVESAGEAAFRPLDGVVAALDGGGNLTRVAAELTRERERVRGETARADTLAAENERLAALLGLDGSAGVDGVAARVVSIGGTPGDTLLIDRGGGSGIGVGMPVVAAGGLVGRVVEVSPGHSVVLPVTDPASAVGVRCGSAAGVVEGRGRATLRLDLLDPSAAPQSDELVVTSGLRRSLFPAGLPVGRVTGERGRLAVQPFAPPDRLELVKVLRWEPQP